MIMVEKKEKPKFNVLNLGFKIRVKDRWRKPRGTHNKKRLKMEWTGGRPSIGYKNAAQIRGLHPDGNPEVLVHNAAELEGLSDVTVRIASPVGARKRKLIEEKAKSMKLRVTNSREKKKYEPRKKGE
ncbi:50S ribosomal protein L32e [Candidatus Micrarchaeota archaeon]|nr:50S ribosomal protein L32e [Candidatus Micrarchaeota archaeon]